MSVIAKRIDGVIGAGLAPLLKEAGFKKQARNFRRAHNDHTDVINVQLFRYNDATHGRFTVNLGVYYPAIAGITEAFPVEGKPKEYDCTVRQRIGFLLEAGTDFWWEIDQSTDDADTAADLESAVAKYGLPWLDSLSDLNVVKRFARDNHGEFVAAGIALHLGDRDEAQYYFDRDIAKGNKYALPKLIEWAKKHGLAVPEG